MDRRREIFLFSSQEAICGPLLNMGNLFGKANGQPACNDLRADDFLLTFAEQGRKQKTVRGWSNGAGRTDPAVRLGEVPRSFVPFLSGIPADSVSFSKDGQRVAYVSFPEGALWTSKIDGSQRLQLSYLPL